MISLINCYFILNVLVCLFLLRIAHQAANNCAISKKRRNIKLIAWSGIVGWQLFIFIISESGFTVNLNFPPRFALVFILPAFLFTAIFIFKNRASNWLKRISIKELTIFQSFRIAVESLFVWSVAAGVLHENVTIDGYNFDMVFAFSAPFAYLLTFIYGSKKYTFLKLWNYLGLIVLASVIFVFISTLYFPTIYGFTETPLTESFLKYPYILVAGFMMPVAVFIHCLSLIKLDSLNASEQY